MADTLSLLDQALDLGAEELELLALGQVGAAEQKAQARSQLMARAWEVKGQDRMDELKDKLEQLQSLQGRLTTEARRLHASIKEELKRTKQESARQTGYGKAAKAAPRYSRFVSKNS
jgi:hypothetical protein